MRTATTLLTLVALATSVAAARADQPPSAEELLTRSRAATGSERRPENEREVWSIRVAGLEGTLETMRRGADTRSTTALGPFHTERGVWHGLRWHQNENGETILERPGSALSARIVAQSVVRVREPVDAWEVSTTHAGGHVLREYYDPKTYFLVRQERVVAGRTTHTTYEDFRVDARGRTRPWRFDGGDERPETDFDYKLERDDVSPEIAETEFLVPHDRRPLVEFPAGTSVVRLPARIERGRIYVRLDIGRRGLDFLLDTGSASLTIDESVARQLGLMVYGRTSQTVAGVFQTGRVVAPAVAIGELTMHDVVMRTAPFSSQESPNTRVVGLLGFDFLDAVALKIDYADGTVDAVRPGDLAVPAGAASLDVRLDSGAPVARATIGDASGDDFILDTGAALSYVVFQRFARAHPGTIEVTGDGRVRYGSGIGGTLSLRPVTVKKLALGASTFPSPFGAEALGVNALGFDDQDGLIGADILKCFTVYLDYGSNRVYLAPAQRQQTALGPGSLRR